MYHRTSLVSPLRAALGFALVALLAWLAGCGGGSGGSAPPPPDGGLSPDVYEYRVAAQGRALNYGRWYNYIQSDEQCPSGIGFPLSGISPAACFNWLTDSAGPAPDQWVDSLGPWWIDPNHQMVPGGNGFGFVNVIGFMRLPSAIYAPADLTNATVTFDSMTHSGWSTVTAPSRLGMLKSHVHLWFQTAPRTVPNCTPNDQVGENCTRQSDYILTGHGTTPYQIDTGKADTPVARSFQLDPTDDANWTCLGAGLNIKYDCLPFSEAIKQISVIGFLAAPVLPCPVLQGSSPEVCDMAAIRANPAAYFNVGEISLRNFNVKQAFQRRTQVAPLTWQAIPAGAHSSIAGWSPIDYTTRQTFAEGGGVRLAPQSGYTRFGISAFDNTQDFSLAGPQIYIAPWEPIPGIGTGQLRIVDKDADGHYTADRFVATYVPGDAIDIVFTASYLLVLKNGDVAHRFPYVCPTSCEAFTFASQLESTPGVAPVGF